MQLFASDIGYGSSKFKSKNSMFKFPTAVAHVKHSQANISSSRIYDYKGMKYFVGEDASTDALKTRDYFFLAKYAPLLLFKGMEIAKIDFTQPVSLATGLSLMNWNQKEEFANNIKDFVTNNVQVKNIIVNLIPQGKGVYIDCIDTAPDLDDKLVLVVDIGYNTTDVIPFMKGRAIAHEAWAENKGISVIINQLRKIISNKFGVNCSEHEVNHILHEEKINIGGETRDLSIFIIEEVNAYCEMIINDLKSNNGDLFKRADKIILAGGGAYIFKKYHELERNIIFAETPYEYANVKGYYRTLI